MGEELRCPGADWFEFGQFCYKPFDEKKTWPSARQACQGLGAELVSILSKTEQSFVESYLYMGKELATVAADSLVKSNFICMGRPRLK